MLKDNPAMNADAMSPQIEVLDGYRKIYCRTSEQLGAVPWEILVPGDVVHVMISTKPATGETHEKV